MNVRVRVKKSLRSGLGMLALLAASSGCSSEAGEGGPSQGSLVEDTRPAPNVIVVVVDDLRYDEFGAGGHPYLETPHIDRLAAEGATFANAFHAVPLCSPNRASILTGQYPSRHGIIDNVARNRLSHRLNTFPIALQEAGYETGFLGKWHMGNDPTPRPGFDYWAGIPGQGRTVNPELYENGQLREVEGYITDILTDRAVGFIEKEREKPFFLYIGHKAVHPDTKQFDDGSVNADEPREYVPAPRHLGTYEGRAYPRSPSAVRSTAALGGKPALQRSLTYRESPEIVDEFGPMLDLGTAESTVQRRAEMVRSVDDGLGRMMSALEAQGELDNTLIVFTSDNGFFFGEHWLSHERRLPYEESIRMPILVRYPAMVTPGTTVPDLAVSIDIAPTVLDFAGAHIGDHLQGRSMAPALADSDRQPREAVLVEFYTYENPRPWLMDMDYKAVRTDRYKLIHWIQYPNERELYDLANDPYEMENLVNDPAHAEVLSALEAEMARLVAEAVGITRAQNGGS